MNLLLLVVLIGVWTDRVYGKALLSISPSTPITSGSPVVLTCTGNDPTAFYILLYKNIKTPKDPYGRIIASADVRTLPNTARIDDTSLSDRAKATPGTEPRILVMNFTETNCATDAYGYTCYNNRKRIFEGQTKALTIIDLDNFRITSLQLRNTNRCPSGISQTECNKCAKGDTSLPVRNKGEQLEFTCVANLLFPSEQPNTFKWYTKDINGDWMEQFSNDFSPSRRTPTTTTPASNTEPSYCYNSTEPHNSTLEYTPDATTPRMLQVRCEVTFEYKGLTQKREKIMPLCIVGGMEPPTTTTPNPKKTTPKTEGKDKSGFSLLVGPGIALMVACVVVVVAAIGGAGFWFYRRQHRAPAQENADDYYADGGENYS